jgi:hypothetical protein
VKPVQLASNASCWSYLRSCVLCAAEHKQERRKGCDGGSSSSQLWYVKHLYR